MSSAFGLYSRYYDVLYQDKDYVGEADYVQSMIERFAPHANELLELGCGTARHACLLAAAGYNVHGIERSEEMLNVARQRIDQKSDDRHGLVSVQQGDVTGVQLNRLFDCVISLFLVVSYQTTDADALSIFQTAHEHLRPGGIFLFDLWYGPAVMHQQPERRVKEMQGDGLEVSRIAEPTMIPDRNIVEVNYTVDVREIQTGKSDRLFEKHVMRYFFESEIATLAQQAGLQIEHAEQWLDGAEPSTSTWGVAFVARK